MYAPSVGLNGSTLTGKQKFSCEAVVGLSFKQK